MTRRKKAGWVKMGPSPWLGTCERCGGHIDQPPLPTPVDAFVKYLEYAIAAHADCVVSQ